MSFQKVKKKLSNYSKLLNQKEYHNMRKKIKIQSDWKTRIFLHSNSFDIFISKLNLYRNHFSQKNNVPTTRFFTYKCANCVTNRFLKLLQVYRKSKNEKHVNFILTP